MSFSHRPPHRPPRRPRPPSKAQKIKVVDTVLALIGGRDGVKRWCQKANALDAAGNSVDARDKVAVRWCAYGAFEKATKSVEVIEAIFCESRAENRNLISINDREGRGAVLRFLRSYKKTLEAK